MRKGLTGKWAGKSPAETGMDATRAFISPNHNLIVVWRWSAEAAEGFRRVVAAITS